MTVPSDSSPECLGRVVVPDPSPECFSKIMASMPGFRFHPTDEELVAYYLKRKMCRRKLKLDAIRETDVYKWDPEDLPGQSILKTGDRQWFFFSPRDRKYPNGARSNRATRQGYWKATGKDRNVTCNSRTVGVKKTLVFYRGKAPNGKRTDWVMHEYTLDEEELQRCQGVKDYYALYKVFKKSGPGPKNGEQYGAPFKEEEWIDDDFVDFNVNSADLENLNPQLNEFASVDTVPVNGQVQQSLLDDEIEEILRSIMENDPVLNQAQVNALQVVEETESTVVDESAGVAQFSEVIRMFSPSGQQYGVQPSNDFGHFAQSATSHLNVSEAPEVTSAPNNQPEGLLFHEDDFLEIDDLIVSEPTSANIENLQFEDGLSEFGLYHDAVMFLHDIGPIDQDTVSNPYMNTHDSNTVNQDYQFLPNPDVTNEAGGDLWMHGQRNILSPAELTGGSHALPTSGDVCESAGFPTEGNENQNSTLGGVTTSRLSSAVWAFVESIPTTPASASENALVNRAFERMSSFSRVRINIKQTNVAAGNDTATVKRAGRKGVLFLFFPVLVALCAFLWVSMGTLRLLRRYVS